MAEKDAETADRPKTPQKPAKPAGRPSDPGAAERLAAALRENLRRRKQQARHRRAAETGPGDPEP